MSRKIRPELDLDEPISQKLKLLCCQCGQRGIYDVGTIYYDQEGEGESIRRHYSFRKYFRCRQCDSPGPWELADFIRMMGLALRLKVNQHVQGLRGGRCVLFDGTFIQTPAMGEAHLLRLIKKEPRNAFLHTRLGNLFRTSGERAKASEWFEKALKLDPGDIEARCDLFIFATDAQDFATAAMHSSFLAGHLLEGKKTRDERLTEAIAAALVHRLRGSLDFFRQRFGRCLQEFLHVNGGTFIRSLLEQEGDEEEIASTAIDGLLSGNAKPFVHRIVQTQENAAPVERGEEGGVVLVSSLQALVEMKGLNPEKLTVPLEANGGGDIRVNQRHVVPVFDGKKMAFWQAPPLREMFRGSKPAPPDIERYPPEYRVRFFFIESHVLTLGDSNGDRSDQELKEVYSAMRRRPDGRSLGVVHDFLWQVSALLLGSHPLSEAEFEALFGQLARSTRRWAINPISRNYMAYLRRTFPSPMGEFREIRAFEYSQASYPISTGVYEISDNQIRAIGEFPTGAQ